MIFAVLCPFAPSSEYDITREEKFFKGKQQKLSLTIACKGQLIYTNKR
jgi:hypothetical protein